MHRTLRTDLVRPGSTQSLEIVHHYTSIAIWQHLSLSHPCDRASNVTVAGWLLQTMCLWLSPNYPICRCADEEEAATWDVTNAMLAARRDDGYQEWIYRSNGVWKFTGATRITGTDLPACPASLSRPSSISSPTGAATLPVRRVVTHPPRLATATNGGTTRRRGRMHVPRVEINAGSFSPHPPGGPVHLGRPWAEPTMDGPATAAADRVADRDTPPHPPTACIAPTSPPVSLSLSSDEYTIHLGALVQRLILSCPRARRDFLSSLVALGFLFLLSPIDPGRRSPTGEPEISRRSSGLVD
nr:unnamed protein product [Digitaria exilis]